MRPLVFLLALCALLLLPACQSNDGAGPSSALELQPGVGGGARVFAGPEDGVGCAAQLNLGNYGLRTGKAAEPAPTGAPVAPQAKPCPVGTCAVNPAARVPEAPVVDVGGAP